MKTTHRLLLAFSAIMLLALFIWPMWRITLLAPQYPSGVTMYIHVNRIDGSEPGTLQNINILNHYVGMKKIEPDAIPELSYFQYVVLGLSLFGVLAALIGNRRLALIWLILLVLSISMGIYDFYLWEYSYGHDLSPTAPIQFDGMAYQPPLIGRKTLLNFVAISMPHIGGYFVVGSIFLGFWAWLKGKRPKTV